MSNRKIALAAGVLFIITFVTSIPALYLFQPVLDDPAGYIAGSGADNTRIFVGATLELLLIVANVATAVVLFPILKRQNEMLALGYVTARLVESTFIAIGLVSVLGVVSLQQQGATGADAGTVGVALAAIKDWTFLLGPGFIVGIGNGLLLGYLMYESGLVPRRMAMLGLVGGPLICASGILVLLGVFDEGGAGQGIATIPEFFWELSLGVWLTVKGFNRIADPPAGWQPCSAAGFGRRHARRRRLTEVMMLPLLVAVCLGGGCGRWVRLSAAAATRAETPAFPIQGCIGRTRRRRQLRRRLTMRRWSRVSSPKRDAA